MKIPIPGGLTKPSVCKKPYDIAIFLDAALDSDGRFSSQLNFLTQLTGLFEVSPTSSRFGIGTYSKSANVIIPFSDIYAEKSLLKDAIETIRYLNGENIAGMTLQEAVSVLFDKQESSKVKRPKIVIFKTNMLLIKS